MAAASAGLPVTMRSTSVEQNVHAGVEPRGEGRVELPQAREMQHGGLQCRAVLVYQFARQQHHAFIQRAVERVEAGEQELRQLGGKSHRRRGAERVGVVGRNARFRGVRDDEAHVRIGGQREVIRVHRRRIDFTLHAGDQAVLPDRRTGGVEPVDEHREQAVLHVEQRRSAATARAHDHDAGIETGALVEQVDLPVEKAAHEVPLAELEDFDRQRWLGGALKCVHNEMSRFQKMKSYCCKRSALALYWPLAVATTMSNRPVATCGNGWPSMIGPQS